MAQFQDFRTYALPKNAHTVHSYAISRKFLCAYIVHFYFYWDELIFPFLTCILIHLNQQELNH